MTADTVGLASLFGSLPRHLFEEQGMTTNKGDPHNLAMAFADMSPAAAMVLANQFIGDVTRARAAADEAQYMPYKHIINPQLDRDNQLITQGQVPLAVQASKERSEQSKADTELQRANAQWAQQMGIKQMEVNAQNARHQTASGDARMRSATEEQKREAENMRFKLGYGQKEEFHKDDMADKAVGRKFQEQKLSSEETRAAADPMKGASEKSRILIGMEKYTRGPEWDAVVERLGEERARANLYQVLQQRDKNFGAKK